MVTEDTDRLSRLVWEIEAMQKELSRERALIEALREELDDTKRKIDRAESWGRGILWATLAISGFLSQFNNIVAWIKKL